LLAGLPLRDQRYRVNRSTCAELVATGRFLTVVPGFSLNSPHKHPSLRALSVELPNARRPIAIFTLKNRTLSPRAQLFASVCVRSPSRWQNSSRLAAANVRMWPILLQNSLQG